MDRGWRSSWAVAVSMTITLWCHSAPATIKAYGVVLDDDNYKKVSESRFRSKDDWVKTVRFLRASYGGKTGYVWRPIDTPPKVKAIHIENTHMHRTWEGINVYETNGEVYVYVIKAERSEARPLRGR